MAYLIRNHKEVVEQCTVQFAIFKCKHDSSLSWEYHLDAKTLRWEGLRDPLNEDVAISFQKNEIFQEDSLLHPPYTRYGLPV